MLSTLSKMLRSYGFRKFKNRIFFFLCLLCVVIAVIPLASIIIEVIVKGAPVLSINFLTADGLDNGGRASVPQFREH